MRSTACFTTSRSATALFDLNQTLEAKVAERTRELSEANQRLEDMVMTDVLTGLPPRPAQP